MPKTIDECKELDKRFNGSRNDFDETLEVIYYIDKKHRVKAKLDIFKGILMIGENSSMWSKQHQKKFEGGLV
jgi:hypothetical protein